MAAKKWEVVTKISNGWENTWHDETESPVDGQPVMTPITFDTVALARAALREHKAELKDAGMDYSPGDFGIQRGKVA